MRRAQAFAAACAIFAIALLGVLPTTLIHSELGATALLAGVAIVFAIGECVHGVVLGPLVADLAPPHLLGRYISLYSLTVTGGLALGPAIGGAVLATSPDAVWWGGALVTVVIGAGFLLAGDASPTSRWPWKLVSPTSEKDLAWRRKRLADAGIGQGETSPTDGGFARSALDDLERLPVLNPLAAHTKARSRSPRDRLAGRGCGRRGRRTGWSKTAR